MKKVLLSAIVISLLTVGTLFASGSSESTNSKAAAPVPIQFLNIGPTKAVTNLFKQTIDPAFEAKYPNIKVSMITTDWGSAFQKVTTGIAAGTAPDVMVIGGIWVAPLASKGGLLPLETYVNKMPDKNDIYAAAWKDTEYKGHIYGIPWNLDVRTFIYRKDLFSAAGLDPNHPPTTWAEYLADAKKLAKVQNGQVVRAGTLIGLDTSIGIQQYFAQLFFQAGGSYYTADGKANFDSPAGLKAAELIKKLIAEKATSPNFVTNPGSASPLTLGTAAMDFNGVGAFQNARTYAPKVVDNIGVGQPLKMDGSSTPATVVWVNKIALFKGTKHPQAAWDYGSFITSAKYESQWARLVGNLPSRKSVAASAPWKSDKVAQELLATMKYAHVQPANPNMFQIPHIIQAELMNMIYNKETPKQALQTMDQKINALLAQ